MDLKYQMIKKDYPMMKKNYPMMKKKKKEEMNDPMRHWDEMMKE